MNKTLIKSLLYTSDNSTYSLTQHEKYVKRPVNVELSSFDFIYIYIYIYIAIHICIEIILCIERLRNKNDTEREMCVEIDV